MRGENIFYSALTNFNYLKIEDIIMKSELSKTDALKITLSKGGAFAMSRLMISASTLLINWALSRLGPNQVASGPLLTSLQYLIMGTFRGALLGSGIVYGNYYGAKKFSEIGNINHAALKLASILSLVSILLLNTAPLFLKEVKLANPEVIKFVEEYFNYFSLGVLPTLWGVADQQVAVAAQKASVTFGFGAMCAVLSSVIGIPMALGYCGKFFSGLKGFSIGLSMASWFSYFCLRAFYYYNADYSRYQLFSTEKSHPSYIRDLSKIGAQMGGQVLTEWLNLLLISVMFSAVGNNSLTVIQPFIQCSCAWSLVVFGMAQGVGVLISNQIGAIKKSIADGENETVLTQHTKNIQLIGNSGLLIGGAFSLLVCGSLFVFSKGVCSFFIGKGVNEETLQRSQELFKVGVIGLFFDSIRNSLLGNLRGFKDVNFSMWLSFFLISLVGLGAGLGVLLTGTAHTAEKNFLWIRCGMILLTNSVLALRWGAFCQENPAAQLAIFNQEKRGKTIPSSCFKVKERGTPNERLLQDLSAEVGEVKALIRYGK